MDKESVIDILRIDDEIKKMYKNEEKNLENYNFKGSQIINMLNNNTLSLKLQNDLESELKILNQKIDDISNKTSINFYIMESSSLLEKYKEILSKPVKISFIGKPKDQSILREKEELVKNYLSIVSKYYDINLLTLEEDIKKKKCHGISNHVQIIICENCISKNCINILDGKTYICENCGFEKEILGNISSYKDATRVNLSSKYTYERRIHFRDCMNQYQGKQNKTIPPEVYKDLEEEFEKNHLLIGNKDDKREERFKNISKDHVLLFLKETGHTKHYEDVFLIHYKMTGKKPDDISLLENKLIEDFETLSNLYDKKFKHDKTKKIDRKSFINVQYVLYQLLRKYKHPCRKEDFNILKTLDRKAFHDEIMKELFEELGWNFSSPQF